MIYKHDIQYITDFYTPGSEAVKVAPKEQPKKAAPKIIPREQIKVYVDPVALASVVVAAVLLVLMAVSMLRFVDVCEQHELMESKLIQIQDENALKYHEYRSGYDLDEIREQALALGMIPASEAQTFTVSVTIPEPEPEPTWWENVVWFLEGLFA